MLIQQELSPDFFRKFFRNGIMSTLFCLFLFNSAVADNKLKNFKIRMLKDDNVSVTGLLTNNDMKNQHIYLQKQKERGSYVRSFSDHSNNGDGKKVTTILMNPRNLSKLSPHRTIQGASKNPVINKKLNNNKGVKKNKLIPVDFANIHINKQELASMHAVSQLCLKILNPKLHPQFEKAFSIQLTELFPSIKNPKKAMKYLSTKKDYQQLLNNWKNLYSKEDNIALCDEVLMDNT